jgi:2-phospho-L-lactate guanylyltransferase
MLWALVPAKLSSEAKERLDPLLPRELRVELARAMLLDVLAALATSDCFAGIAVVSRDHATLELAAGCRATPIVEQEGVVGLNGAVAQGVARCIAAGASAVLIAMGDIPLVSAAEIRGVAERLPERGAVLVPSADGTGTNILALRPPDALPTRFGVASLALHRAVAEALGLTAVIHEAPGAALDVDTVADLERLVLASRPATATHDVLVRARPELRLSPAR